MDDFITIILTVITTAAGGFLQSLAGFGFAIISMTVFPYIYGGASTSAAITGALSVLGSSTVTYRMRKKVSVRRCIWPLAGYIALSSVVIFLSVSWSESWLKILLGVLLIILALYYSFCGEKLRIPATPVTGVIAGALSGILGGLFSISGPPVVLYFSASSPDNDTYMADIQLYFAMTSLYATILRIINGRLTLDMLPLVVLGYSGYLVGIFIGRKVYTRLSRKTMIYIICILMAVSGINLIIK